MKRSEKSNGEHSKALRTVRSAVSGAGIAETGIIQPKIVIVPMTILGLNCLFHCVCQESPGTQHYTKIILSQQIEFTPVSRFVRIFLRKMTFEISDQGDHCELTARVVLKWVGPLAKKLNEDTFNAMRKHMREEGENLKKILEGKTDN